VHAALSALSEVIVSWPSMDQIQAEEVDLSIRLLVCSQADDKDLGASLEQVEDLQDVQVVSWDPESEPEEGEEEIEEAEVSQLAIASEGADAGTASQGQVKAPARQQTVRVDVERIDHMMNTVGELIIDRTRIVQIGKALEARYKDDDFVRALGETSAHIVKVIDELQESTMKVRMLPIGTVFGSFPRLIRDLSQSIGKKVEFTIEGAETEIGIISDGNAGHVGRPIIRLCFDRDGEPVQRPYDIDLSDPDYQDRMVLQVLEY
jgi:two-component system chemotaxis sensor kinase CheA